LKIEPLKRVNLISGQNDTGKTTLLEALRILLAQPDPSAAGNLPNEFRGGAGGGDSIETFWKWLDVQVFATTQSWECIVAADAAARKGQTYELNPSAWIELGRYQGKP